MHWLGSKIIRTSEDSTSRSEDSDGNTPQLTADFPEDTTRRSDGGDGSAPQLTSRLPSYVNNTASNAKKPIRGPPELNKVLPSLADINTTTKPADLPVDVLLLTVKNCEFLACYSELKNPYRCYFDRLGYVYFSDVDRSQEKVKVALLRCYENSSCPGGSLISVKNAATQLSPKAVISVGVCSGLHPENSKLGDVVVSVKLTTYASKVVINNQEHSTGMRNYVSKCFLNVIKNCADGWQAPLKNLADAQQVQVHTAAEFLSGPEQVISEQRRDQLAETNPQAMAMENEGEGKLTIVCVCHYNIIIIHKYTVHVWLLQVLPDPLEKLFHINHPLPVKIFGILIFLLLPHWNSIDYPWGSYGYFLERYIPFIGYGSPLYLV